MNPILVALDVPTAERALALADQLRGAVGGFKIGKQLFTAEGPGIVRTLAERGDKVFLDLKFHDIPNTVAGAVAVGRGHRRLDGERPLLRRQRDDAGGRGIGGGRGGPGQGPPPAGDRRHRADQHGRDRGSPKSASPGR